MQQILKPRLSTIVIALAVFALTTMAAAAYSARVIADWWPVGVPFHFYEAWGPCPPGELCRAFHPLALLADAAIWYGSVAIGIALIARLRKRPAPES